MNDTQINQMGILTLMTQINQSKHLKRPLETNDSIVNRNVKQLLQLCKSLGWVCSLNIILFLKTSTGKINEILLKNL